MTGVDGVDFAGTPGIDIIETVGLGTDTTGISGLEATVTAGTDTSEVNGAEGVVTVLLGTGVLVVTRKEVGGEDGADCGTDDRVDDLTSGAADCATRFDDWETGSSVSSPICVKWYQEHAFTLCSGKNFIQSNFVNLNTSMPWYVNLVQMNHLNLILKLKHLLNLR